MNLKRSVVLATTMLSVAVFAASPVLAIDATAGGPASADVTIGAAGGNMLTQFPVARMATRPVFTSDGTNIGTVTSVTDGVLIVTIANAQRNAINGTDIVAVQPSSVNTARVLTRASQDPNDGGYSVLTTVTRVVIQTTLADFRSSVIAALPPPAPATPAPTP